MRTADLEKSVGDALGVRVTGCRSVSGGDINDAFELTLDDGRKVFAKTNRSVDPRMFPAEARGLSWLAEARALRIPAVLAADARFLVLERIAPARRKCDFDERLGRGLAALHRFEQDPSSRRLGLDHDNFIGGLSQMNGPASAATWPAFYRERRLEPQLRSAIDHGLVSPSMRRDFERLFATLDELVGPPEPPARLHGDLWGGNLLVDEAGEPCLIDPAVYAGHREVDLAMMRLFGGFGPSVFAAYDEAYPLTDGHEGRVPLYQLYFLMVHVNLFGGSYLPGVGRALAMLV